MTLRTCEAVVAQASDDPAGLLVSSDCRAALTSARSTWDGSPTGSRRSPGRSPPTHPLGELCTVVVNAKVFSVVFGYGTLAGRQAQYDPWSLDLITRAFQGEPTGLTRDDVLDNITLFWLTKTGVSAARLNWEYKGTFFAVKNVTVPVGVSVFPDELYPAPRSWAEQAYPNLSQHDRGGHFAAWEQPQLLSEDVRATFRSLC